MSQVARCSADLGGELLIQPGDVEVLESIGPSLKYDQGDDVALHGLRESRQHLRDLHVEVLVVVDLKEHHLEVLPLLLGLKVLIDPFEWLADEEDGIGPKLLLSKQLIKFSLLLDDILVNLRRLLLPELVEAVELGLVLCEDELHPLSSLEVSLGWLSDELIGFQLDILEVPLLVLLKLSVELLLLFLREVINSLDDDLPLADVMARVALNCFREGRLRQLSCLGLLALILFRL